MLPTLVLVGRPNVGKSTLFNRLTRSRDALVADLPGLTRDRHYGDARVGGRDVIVVDTGGFEPQKPTGIVAVMARQTQQAVAEADAVVFVVDLRAGLSAQDHDIARFLLDHGADVHLLHDCHHRLTPIQAARLGKDLEPYRLFWMEDPTPAELQESFRAIRRHTTTPLAVGEVFNTIHDCHQLIEEQLIDYIRTTVVHAGGISHLRKIAHLAEQAQQQHAEDVADLRRRLLREMAGIKTTPLEKMPRGRVLELGEDLILGFRMCIDDTAELAIQRARPYFEEHAKVMAPLGMLRYSEEHVKAVAARQPQSPTTASLENGVRNRSWLCGPPADIVAYLKEIEARYPGLDHMMIAWAIGTPREVMIEQLGRFAREVMPAFRGSLI